LKLFHVKHRPLAAVLLLLAGGLAAACGSVSGPEGWAPPIQTETLLLANAGDGDLLAVDPDSFALLWEFPRTANEQISENANPEGIYSRPLADDAFIFIGAYNGELYKVHANTGLTAFEAVDLGDAVVADLVSDGNVLYAATNEGLVFALNNDDLADFWPAPFEAEDRIWATPLLNDGTLYVAAMDHKLYALDATTGEPLWPEPFEADGALAMDPVLADGRLLVGSFDRQLYVLDPATGRSERAIELEDWLWSRPVLSDNQDTVVYTADLSGRVWAIDIATGDLLWNEPYEAGDHIRGSGLLAGDVLVYADTGGNVHFVNAADGSPASEPVIASPEDEEDFFADLVELEGTIYAQGESGRLYTVDPDTFRVSLVPLPERAD
jgi:outer membrane protein assembly factor BamB